jgi:hypothetical protein
MKSINPKEITMQLLTDAQDVYYLFDSINDVAAGNDEPAEAFEVLDELEGAVYSAMSQGRFYSADELERIASDLVKVEA